MDAEMIESAAKNLLRECSGSYVDAATQAMNQARYYKPDNPYYVFWRTVRDKIREMRDQNQE